MPSNIRPRPPADKRRRTARHWAVTPHKHISYLCRYTTYWDGLRITVRREPNTLEWYVWTTPLIGRGKQYVCSGEDVGTPGLRRALEIVSDTLRQSANECAIEADGTAQVVCNRRGYGRPSDQKRPKQTEV